MAYRPKSVGILPIERGSTPVTKVSFPSKSLVKNTDDTDQTWIDGSIEWYKGNPTAPYSGIGAALIECEQKGASRQALTDLARGIQAELLFDFCFLLEDARIEEPGWEDFQWGPFEVNEDGNPIGEGIGSLHESVLGADPTRCEIRPRGT